MRAVALSLCCLFLLTSATAHTAAPPRGHEVRLLHDCNDDYFGSDAFGGQEGHELHALDLHEAWRPGTGNVVVFRLTLAGQGPGEIDLALQAAGSSKSYRWTTTGSSWSGSFDVVEGPFQAKNADGNDDGDRFVLHGIVKQSTLGGIGQRLTDYLVQSRSAGGDADAMPGYDGSIVGSCGDDFQRPDYRLQGPTQFAELLVDQATVTVAEGEEVFVQVTSQNLLRDQAQRATITPNGASGITVQMHNPASDAYSTSLKTDLNKKGSAGASKIAHVAITGTQAGASGTVEIELTTEGGGRVVKEISFTVEAATSTPATTTSDPPPATDGDEPASTVAAVLVVGCLLGGAWIRRR